MNTKNNFIKLEIQENIALVTISRENKLNALNAEVLGQLKAILLQLKVMPRKDLYGVILTGEGDKAFVAGADIAELATLNPQEALEVSYLGQEVSNLLEHFNRPVIAAVNGHAMGGGLEMALSCDMIYLTQNALLALPEVKLGLIPGFGGTKRLAGLIGLMKAKEIIFSGRIIKADEAKELGIVLKVFETKSQMIEFSKQWLKDIAKNSLVAIASAKKSLQEGYYSTTASALQNEAEYFSQLFATADMLEGTKAFMDKRVPQFKQEL